MKLAAEGVVVRYRSNGRVHEAVRGVSLAVNSGERWGLIGESGSGKSSLVRALLGLEPLAAGTVTLDGAPMAKATLSMRKRVQPVFQEVGTSLDPMQRIRTSLREPFEIHGLSVDDAKLLALLHHVQLGPDVLDRMPSQLSVGQRQRINIARALALDPELLILDEPVSSLDVSVQAQIISLLQGLVRERGCATLLVSHDLDVVAHLCDRVAVMYAGQLVEVGPRAELWSAPQHAYTRELLAKRHWKP